MPLPRQCYHTKRTEVVVVLISKEGTGKGLVVNKFGDILGSQCFVSESIADNIFGKFNSVLSCKTLVILNELLWAGSHENRGSFFDKITDKTVTINEKHQVQRPETAFQNYMVVTNGSGDGSGWAVPASCEARRFFVLEPSEMYCGVKTAESAAYFNAVASVKAEHFANFLYNRDLSGFDASMIPDTPGLVKQKEQSLSAVPAALLDCLQRGRLPGDPYTNDTRRPTCGHSFGERIARNQIKDDWTNVFQSLYGWPNTPQKFWHALETATERKGVSILIDEGRRMESGDRQHWMRFKPLQECRDWWDKHMFVPSTGWPDVEDPVDRRKLQEEKQRKIDAIAAEMRPIESEKSDLGKRYHLLKSQKRNSECEQILQEIQLLDSKLKDLSTKQFRI